MKQKIELNAEDITLFAMTSPLNDWDDLLVGTDSKGLTSFWGGKKDSKRDRHIFDTLNGEGVEEIAGTIFPENFGNPDFQQNFVFASCIALPFFTSKTTNKLVKGSKQLAANLGNLKLRIGVRMFEVSGNAPVQVNEKEMGSPVYRKVQASEPNMREAVRLMLLLSQAYGCWDHDKLVKPNIGNPTRLKITQLREDLDDMGVSQKTLREHFFFPSDFKFAPRPPRHLIPNQAAA